MDSGHQPRASHPSKYTYMCTATHRHTQEPTNVSRHTHTQKEDMHIHMRRVEGYLEVGKIVETVKVLVIPAWRTEPDPQNPLKVKGENQHHKVVL